MDDGHLPVAMQAQAHKGVNTFTSQEAAMTRPCDSVFEGVQAARKWMAYRDDGCDAVSEGHEGALP